MASKSDVIALHKSKDYLTLLATTALSYGPHLTLMMMMNGPGSVARHTTTVAAMILATQVPYLREIPLLASRLFVRAFVVKGVKAASPRVSALFNEVAQAADIKNLKVYEYERGQKGNAIAFADSVYLGRSLIDTMDDRELKAIIAHEVAHHKTRDSVPTLMAWFPYWSSILMCVSAGLQAAQSKSLTMSFCTMAAAYGYYKYQKGVRAWGSRVLEHRADRNAVNFTRDPVGMIRLQDKLESGGGDIMVAGVLNNRNSLSHKFKKLFSTHPDAFERAMAIAAHGERLTAAGLLPPQFAADDFQEELVGLIKNVRQQPV